MSAYSSGSIIKILVKRIEFQLDGTWKVRQELSVKVKPKTVDTAHGKKELFAFLLVLGYK